MPPGPNPAVPVPGLVPPQPDVNAVPQYGLDGAEVSVLPLPQKALRCLNKVKNRQTNELASLWSKCSANVDPFSSMATT